MTSVDRASSWITLTAVLSASARPAAVTRSHGDALEQLMPLIGSDPYAGIDIVELPIAPQTFNPLREFLQKPAHSVALYDVFAVPANVSGTVRKIAAQYLAAESLKTLEAQGVLGGVPLSIHLDVPSDWQADMEKIGERLRGKGALAVHDAPDSFIKPLRAQWHEHQASQTR